MDCLKGYIGYKSLQDYTTPPAPDEAMSGLFINQLPGVSFEMVEDITDTVEQVSDVKVWEEVEMRGLKKFALSIKAELNKCYRITDPGVVSCLVCEKKDLFAVALWYFLGVELMIERTSSDRLNRYTTIDLEKAEKLKAEFYAEFQTCLTDAVGSMTPADSDCVTGCLDCNGSTRWVEQTP